ncbi:TolC family protein, partial [Klebsiella pneumoniae]
LQIAESNNATLRATQAQLDAAHGARREARSPLYNNPQVSIDRTRRDVPQAGLPTDRRWEWGAGITQALEIAGQQGLRRDIAGASLTAVQEDI